MGFNPKKQKQFPMKQGGGEVENRTSRDLPKLREEERNHGWIYGLSTIYRGSS